MPVIYNSHLHIISLAKTIFVNPLSNKTTQVLKHLGKPISKQYKKNGTKAQFIYQTGAIVTPLGVNFNRRHISTMLRDTVEKYTHT
jgi:hypothetical protein